MNVGEDSREYLPQDPRTSQAQKGKTTVTVTKVVTTRQVRHGSHSSLPPDQSVTYSDLVTPHAGSQGRLPPPSPGRGSAHSPASPRGQAPPSSRSEPNLYESPMPDGYPPNGMHEGGPFEGRYQLGHYNDQDSFDPQFPYYSDPPQNDRYNNGPTHQESPYVNSPQFGSQQPLTEDPYSRIPGRKPDHLNSREPLYNSHQDEPPYGSQSQLRPEEPYFQEPNNSQPPRGSNQNLSGPRYPVDDPYGDQDQYSDRSPNRGDDSFSDRPDQPSQGKYFPPLDGSFQGVGPDKRYPGESPYGSRSQGEPWDSPRHGRDGPYRPEEEDPYGSRQPLSQTEAPPLESPYDRAPQEDPYGSRQRLPRDDPYSRPPQEDPYARNPPQEDEPYRQNPPEEDPYGRSQPRPEDPYSRGPPFTESPYSRGPSQSEDPYGRGPPREEDPYSRGPPREEDPYSRGPPREEDPYSRGPPRAEDPYGPGPPRDEDPYGRRPNSQEDPYGRDQPRDDFGSNRPLMPSDRDRFLRPEEDRALMAPPDDRRSQRTVSPAPSFDRHDQKWRNPDLPEVIEYLSHPNDSIKANAAAYLQHLCYMDDQTKAKTRALGGIPVLVELVGNKFPEVHRAACGALRNLSYGKANDENKLEIQKAGGIPQLVRLLRKSPDNDVRELVTGILWNLSSLQPLKQPIIDDGLAVIVNTVILPHSGWDKNGESSLPKDVYWSTVFRNASGVLRNVSSDGAHARKKLRECEGLVESILHIVKAAIGKSDIDNKPVENCVCILRNLSYACQEVSDPNYLKKRNTPNNPDKGESTGCFGGKKKKDSSKDKSQPNTSYRNDRPVGANSGMALLWHPSVVGIYLPLLSDCTNPETLEAAAGAIQNLAACEWEPSAEIRSAVRKEKGLPVIVDLLTLDADRVICAAASALRNLVLDVSSKELIGKYAMHQLVIKLPNDRQELVASNETICAVECLLYEVVKNSIDFARAMTDEGGCERLVYITKCQRFSPKVVKFACSLLNKMWSFKELQPSYKARNLKESDFLIKPKSSNKSPPDSTHSINSTDNTLNRPGMSQGGPTMAGYNEHTMPGVTRAPPVSNNLNHGNYRDGSYPDGEVPHTPRDNYRGMDGRYGQDIPMTQLGPPPQDPHASPGYYDTIDSRRGDQHPPDYDRHQSYDRAPNDGRFNNHSFEQNSYDPQRPHDTSYDRHPNNYRGPPPGGVPLFPNLPPASQTPVPQDESREPLYAKVNKQSGRRTEPGHVNIGPDDREGGQGPGGADSWV